MSISKFCFRLRLFSPLIGERLSRPSVLWVPVIYGFLFSENFAFLLSWNTCFEISNPQCTTKRWHWKPLTPSSPGRPLPLLIPVECWSSLEGFQETVHHPLLVVWRVEVNQGSLLLRSLRPLALLLLTSLLGARLLSLRLALLDDFVVGILKEEWINVNPINPLSSRTF